MTERRVALLVDGDNVSPRYFSDILTHAGRLGRVDIARVYAALQQPSDWLTTSGVRVMHAGAGKNAADLLLTIDAMEFALSDHITSFAIAASDRDYTHLALRLRERGLHVLGLGEPKAPEAFRKACSRFQTLGDAGAEDGTKDSTKDTAKDRAKDRDRHGHPPCGVSAFDQRIRDVIAEHCQSRQGLAIAELNARMRAAHGTQIKTCPEGSWRAYLAARPTLYNLDPRGPDARVRFLPDGFQRA